MRTTMNEYRVPRLLIRISQEDRKNMSEKTITTKEGQQRTLYLNAPWLKQLNERGEQVAEENNKLSVRYGVVIGMSEGVSGYKRGDIAILDYIVDIDDSYLVTMEGADKIVSVPCVTTLCEKELISTSYDEKFIERNVIVEKQGEVNQLSLVLAIVRQQQLIPNDHYLFCDPAPPKPQSLILFTDSRPEVTHIERTVRFSSKRSGVVPGDEIVAIKDSNMELSIGGRDFEIIPITDVLAVIEKEKVA